MANKEFHINTNITYSEDCTKRYILDVCWNQNSSATTVVMLRPSTSNGITFDRTVNNCLDIMQPRNCGRIYIVNLFCNLTGSYDDFQENWKYINECVKNSNDIILAYGAMSGKDSPSKALKSKVIHELADVLKAYKDCNKSFYILSKNNKTICVPTIIKDVKIESRTFDEILELLGEKRESGDNGQK